MNLQSLLRSLAGAYDFSKANQVIRMTQARPFVRPWLTLDLSLATAIRRSSGTIYRWLNSVLLSSLCQRNITSSTDQSDTVS